MQNPGWLAALVLAISFLPNVALGAGSPIHGTGTGTLHMVAADGYTCDAPVTVTFDTTSGGTTGVLSLASGRAPPVYPGCTYSTTAQLTGCHTAGWPITCDRTGLDGTYDHMSWAADTSFTYQALDFQGTTVSVSASVTSA